MGDTIHLYPDVCLLAWTTGPLSRAKFGPDMEFAYADGFATPSEEDRATATGNVDTQKVGEVRPHGFRGMRADRQTDTQTHRQAYSSQYFATLPERSNYEALASHVANRSYIMDETGNASWGDMSPYWLYCGVRRTLSSSASVTALR